MTRHLHGILEHLLVDLTRYPRSRIPTFSENGVSCTIDHWVISSSIAVLDCRPISDISRQDAPLSISLSLPMPQATNLDPRPPNLIFTPDSLRLVQAQMLLLANDLTLVHWNVNQLYNQILGCFLVYGSHRNCPLSGPLTKQWTSFLSEEEREILRDLDRSNQRCQSGQIYEPAPRDATPPRPSQTT